MFRIHSNSLSVNIIHSNTVSSYKKKLNNRCSVEANNDNNIFLSFFTKNVRLFIYLLFVSRNNCFL